jgi:hypothetical protein
MTVTLLPGCLVLLQKIIHVVVDVVSQPSTSIRLPAPGLHSLTLHTARDNFAQSNPENANLSSLTFPTRFSISEKDFAVRVIKKAIIL